MAKVESYPASIPSTSAGLAAIITDETGSGALVFATSPTLTTPVIASIVNTGTLTLPTVTGTIVQKKITSTASSGTPTPTGDALMNVFEITALNANATFAAPSGTPLDGNELFVWVVDAGVAKTLAYDAIYSASSDLPLPGTTIANKLMGMRFMYCTIGSRNKWMFLGFVNNYT